MSANFWMGVLVGFLIGVLSTVIGILLFFVPVRRTVTPAAAPTSQPAVVEYVAAPVATPWHAID